MAVQRSKPYPNMNIIEAVKRIESLKQRSGMSNQYDSGTFAIGIGYKDDKSGAFSRSVAALSQYGLVVKEGEAYRLTEIAKRILIPEEDNDRMLSMRKATLAPSLFSSLYGDFKNQELPSLFENVLVHKYGILDGAKKKVVTIFRSSLEAVDLMDGNRVIDPDEETNEVTPDDNVDTETNDLDNREDRIAYQAKLNDVPSTTLTKDFGEGRVVSVTIPNDITDVERSKLVILIENM